MPKNNPGFILLYEKVAITILQGFAHCQDFARKSGDCARFRSGMGTSCKFLIFRRARPIKGMRFDCGELVITGAGGSGTRRTPASSSRYLVPGTRLKPDSPPLNLATPRLDIPFYGPRSN